MSQEPDKRTGDVTKAASHLPTMSLEPRGVAVSADPILPDDDGKTRVVPPPSERTVVIDRGPGGNDKLPPPGVITDLPALVNARIRERLTAYVEDEETLHNFEPMLEWDLATQGRLSETEILQAYATATGLIALDEHEMERIDAYPDLSIDYLNHWLCVPFDWDSESVTLIAATPYHLAEISNHWRTLMGRTASFYLGQRSHIERLINANYDRSLEESGEDFLNLDLDTSEQALRDLALEAPIVRLVNDMFARAIELGASDIHVEPSEKQLAIRFRIDGVLQTIMQPPVTSFAAIASRLKLIGGLNIAERRLPQDGRTDLTIGRAKIDVRISTLPSMHGESIVLRILRKDTASFTLENIGMPPDLRDGFTKLIGLPHGMILVVGPTGSGKTTSLYCAMNLIDSAAKKVITIEDPIEYQMNGVTQIQVKPAIGLTFASGLRSIVRQDPDVILVGEIRDRETADIAIHAALTGHLVLSTLHTNDAVGAISRLQDMGVENFLLSSALVGVVSQRLVRKTCDDCAGAGAAAGTEEEPKSCRRCNGTGYRGRVGIFEYLQVEQTIRQAITESADNATMNQLARRNGMRSLQEDGQAKVIAGITTPEEVARVCRLDVALD